MGRSMTVRRLHRNELRRLHRLQQQPLSEQQCRRAEVLLLYAAGHTAADIADLLEVDPHTVYADLHAFEQRGLDCVAQPCPRGAPAQLTADQHQAIWNLAEQTPREVGLP